MPNSKLWMLRLVRQRHPFHIVNRSPWPFFISLAALSVTTGAVWYMHRYNGGGSLLFWGIIMVSVIMGLWFRDIVTEATLEGQHTKKVQAGLRLGMKLFITTEVMFFFSFFWAFFHSALAPHTFIGVMWPPKGIIPMYIPDGFSIPETDPTVLTEAYEKTLMAAKSINADFFSFEDWLAWHQPTQFYVSDKPYWVKIKSCVNKFTGDDGFRWAFCYLPLFNPYSIPLAATLILLSSGLTLHIAGMWFNYAKIATTWPCNPKVRQWLFNWGVKFNKTQENLHLPSRSAAYYAIIFWLSLTIFLGLVFTAIQAYEYVVLLPFAINDSVWGSCFYMLTGFHGFHVILGTLGLSVCLYRHIQCHFTKTVHIGFECAAWYWHFVDAVWLFVYSIVYWWSAPLKRPYLWVNSSSEFFTCGTQAWTWDEVVKHSERTGFNVTPVEYTDWELELLENVGLPAYLADSGTVTYLVSQTNIVGTDKNKPYRSKTELGKFFDEIIEILSKQAERQKRVQKIRDALANSKSRKLKCNEDDWMTKKMLELEQEMFKERQNNPDPEAQERIPKMRSEWSNIKQCVVNSDNKPSRLKCKNCDPVTESMFKMYQQLTESLQDNPDPEIQEFLAVVHKIFENLS